MLSPSLMCQKSKIFLDVSDLPLSSSRRSEGFDDNTQTASHHSRPLYKRKSIQSTHSFILSWRHCKFLFVRDATGLTTVWCACGTNSNNSVSWWLVLFFRWTLYLQFSQGTGRHLLRVLLLLSVGTGTILFFRAVCLGQCTSPRRPIGCPVSRRLPQSIPPWWDLCEAGVS